MLNYVARSLPRWVFVLALFLTLFFAKVGVAEKYGSDVPNWDQWDAEGTHLLLPWGQDRLRFLDLFTPHNEHRVALTKLLTLGIVAANGQWDGRLQILANSALHSALAVLMWLWARPLLTRPWERLAWVIGLLATFAPPHAWQNTLGAFHSQQYFLLGFSFIGIERCLRCRTGTGGWWLGLACLVLVLFSMGSGPAAAGIVFVALLGLYGAPWPSARRHALTLAVCVLIMAAGIAMHVEFSGHEPLKAHSWSDFGWTLWRALQWPVTSVTAFGALAYLPWLLLAVRVLFVQSRPDFDDRERVIVAIGGWVMVQFLAAAYARGAGGQWPASRYFDTHTAGLLVNGLAGLVLIRRFTGPKPILWVGRIVLAVWAGAVTHGLYAHARGIFGGDLVWVGQWFEKSARHARLYLATGDSSWLKEGEIPYPSVELFMERVSHPELRRLMPVSVRAPLALKEETTTGFRVNGAPATVPALMAAPNWGSFGPERGAADQGEWRSQVLARPEFGYLRFETLGDYGRGNVSLELRSADLQRLLGRVQPGRWTQTSWQPAYIQAPTEPFRVVARDADPSAWMAFSAPAAMATGSYWGWRLASHALLLFALSAGALWLTLPWALRSMESEAS